MQRKSQQHDDDDDGQNAAYIFIRNTA